MEPEEIESSLQWKKSPEAYIVPIVCAIIFIVGLLGNVMLIIVFLRNRNMRNVSNTFIMSLSVVDLLVILTCIPFYSIRFTVIGWPYGESMCKIVMSIEQFSIAFRAFMLTVLATECFIAIIKPIRLTVGSSVKVAVIFWILAIIWAIPNYLGAHLDSFTSAGEDGTVVTYAACYSNPKTWERNHIFAYILAKFVLFYVVPLIVTAVFYALIARHLVRGPKTQTEQQQILASKKVAITAFTFVVILVICSLPNYIYVFWIIFAKYVFDYKEILRYLSIFGFCLKYSTLCANPIALYCLNGEFRKIFNRYIVCKCKKNQDEQETSLRLQSSVLSEHAT